jgi:hypothetical protein
LTFPLPIKLVPLRVIRALRGSKSKNGRTFFSRESSFRSFPLQKGPSGEKPLKKVGGLGHEMSAPPGKMHAVLNDRRSQVAVSSSDRDAGQIGTNHQCIESKPNKRTKHETNTMNAKSIRKLDMMKRVDRFILEHLITPAIPRLTVAHTEVVNVITALQTAAQNQVAGSGRSEGGVDLRATTARDLREYLKNVNRTARALETDHPGISPTFRLPESGSYPALIARAQAIIAAATPLQASFVDAGLPATFLTELQALLTAFENATNQKYEGGITQVLGTAALEARASLGVKAATDCDAYVRNHFRNNPEMLAAWAHARRIERAPVRSGEETTATATPASAPSGAVEGSTSTVNTTQG